MFVNETLLLFIFCIFAKISDAMENIFVEKFGGASVNSADAVRNVKHILSLEDKKRIVVISAMGKTTNKLENIVNMWFNDATFFTQQYEELKDYHTNIIEDLFSGDDTESCKVKINLLFTELKNKMLHIPNTDYNFLYDSIVSYGEKISTTIVSEYLNACGLKNKLVSAVDLIKTDNNYRDANVNWELTKTSVKQTLEPIFPFVNMVITQGFIGGTKENLSVTLGREGSDYSAAILAHCMECKSMTIWKDVPGLLNADPKRVEKTTKLSSIPFKEAIELSYYGATIIHPKTIKPLENLSIPLYIKSFVNPEDEGSVICSNPNIVPVVPNYIFKDNQLLLSIFPKDFSFIAEKNIATIFDILAKNKVKVNLMQNSAISFSVCFDENRNILPQLLEDLQHDFKVRYNTQLQLITIRHYDQASIDDVLQGREKIIEQRSRRTVQFLVNMK